MGKHGVSTPPPATASAVREFYETYWNRIRRDPWNEAAGEVVRALVGRFSHEVSFCPDGVLIVLRHASADEFAWFETSQGVVDLALEVVGSRRIWIDLEINKLLPGSPSYLGFDLDVAYRPEVVRPEETSFQRIQIRYVPYNLDPRFWSPANAERLAVRNLKGPAIG